MKGKSRTSLALLLSFIVFLSAATWIVPLPANAATANLALVNPGFEQPPANGKIPGWTSFFAETGTDFRYEWTDAKSASGSHSLKIADSRRDKSVAVISDRLNVVPGVAYTGRAKMLLENGSTASLNLRFYDASDKQIAEAPVHNETSKGFPVNQWKEAATPALVAPANAKYARLMAYTTAYAIGVAYYDDMSITYEINDMPAALGLVGPSSITPGQSLSVILRATEVNNLAKASTHLFYDRQKLRFAGVQAAGAFAHAGASVVPTVLDGALVIDAVQPANVKLNADTDIAEVRFEVIGDSGDTWIGIGKESVLNGTHPVARDRVSLMTIGTGHWPVLSDKVFGAPENLSAPIADTIGLFDGTAGKEDGHNVMYTTVKGIPQMFHVIDIDDYKLVRSIPLDDAGDVWSHRGAPDGTVYMAAGGQLWAYSPVTKQARKVFTFPGENVFWAIDIDPAGNVYIATGPGGKVLQYDPVTQQGRDYGRLMGLIGQEYARSIAYSNGYVYVGTSLAKIYKLNVDTGEKVEIGAPLNEAGYCYDIDVVDDKFVIARFDTSQKRYIYNIETGQWLDLVIENSSSGLHIAKQSLNGKVYFPADKKIRTFDVNTYAVEDSGMKFGTGFRGADWVEVDDPDLPGKSIASMDFSGGVHFFNPQTTKVKSYPNLLPPSPSITHVIEKGTNGKIYISGMQASRAAEYDVYTGQTKLLSMGQAGTIVPYGGKMYFGSYPKALFRVYDPAVPPSTANPKTLFNFGDDQDRPGQGVVGGNKIYVGSIPDYGQLGGAITVYDPAIADPAQSFKVYRNIVQDQSIISLAYKDGKIYGSTSINGGLSSQPTTEEAKLFVWDTGTAQKVTEFKLDIPGLNKPPAIGGLSIGPDGLLWGGVNGYIFAIDPGNLKVIKSKNVFPQDGSWGQWGSYKTEWSADGLLYAVLGRRLAVIDPITLESRYFGDSEAFALGEDGNLYYSPSGNRTLMHKITVRNADTENPRSEAIITPQPNEHGWLNTDAVVRITATDGAAGSGVVSVTYSAYGAQSLAPVTARGNTAAIAITSEGVTTVTYGATDRAGNAEPAHALAIRLDKTAPQIRFAGAATFTVDQLAAISCTVTDLGSGLAADPCTAPLMQQPAYMLDPGVHKLAVQAKDKAGNAASAEFAFTVAVTYDSMCKLAEQFTSSYLDLVEKSLCAQLMVAQKAQENGNENAKKAVMKAFELEVRALAGKAFTQEKADILIRLAGYL